MAEEKKLDSVPQKGIRKTKGLKLHPPPCGIQAVEDYFHHNDILTTDVEGLATALKDLHFEEKQATKFAADFFVVGDPEKFGWVDVEDFLEEYTRMQIFKSIRVILSNLAQYDTDGDGEISKEELKAVFDQMLGVEVSAKKTYLVFSTVDVDGSEKLSEKELQNWYSKEEKKIKQKRKKVTRENKKRDKCIKKNESKLKNSLFRDLHLGTELPAEMINAIWYKYDADQSGSISSSELKHVVKDLFKALTITAPEIMRHMLKGLGETPEEVERKVEETIKKFSDVNVQEIAADFMQAMDKDGDGAISKQEFMDEFNGAIWSGTAASRSQKKVVHLAALEGAPVIALEPVGEIEQPAGIP